MLAYPCLVLDHDDTIVKSSPTVNYPSFMGTLAQLRPELHWSLQEFMLYNFDPGFEKMCSEMLGFTAQEMEIQEKNWYNYAISHHPPMFAGLAQLLCAYKHQGGIICVVSHSGMEIIRRDYRKNCGFEPDMVFGWELGPEKRKPAIWPLEQIMQRGGFLPEQLLMVDDLKPGWQMAANCNVDFAFAGWGNPVTAVHEFMRGNATYYLTETEQLGQILKI